MIGTVARASTLYGRNVMRNFIRNGSYGGIPGQTLPFNINNKTRVTWNFIWFGITGIGSPFLIVFYMMYKK